MGAGSILASTGAASDLEKRIEAHVAFLTSAELAGRAPGGTGESALLSYIEDAFAAAGLKSGLGGEWRATFRTDAVAAKAREVGAYVPDSKDGHSISNIVGIVRGVALDDGASQDSKENDGEAREVVLVGAHFDHLGQAEDGTIFHGADDNASGVAALIELARAVADEGPLTRDVLFVAFGGEEVGQLGSRAFVADYPVENVVTMMSLDAIGRMEDRRLFVFGGGSGLEFGEILRGVNVGFGFDLAVNDTGPFASDQVPFYERGVPAMHLSTGANADYHRSTDTAEKLNVADLSETVEFLTELVVFLAERDQRPTFVPPGAASVKPSQAAAGDAPRRVSLGTIPDFARESGGVLLSGVMPGSPAAEAGLEKGDILTSIGGIEVDNLGDFSGVLKSHQPGDEVEVIVTRGTEEIRKMVTLVERASRR
jgi:hypothetical protein